MNKRIRITKVVTKNFVLDFWARLQNIAGQNLTSYEKMIDKGMDQIDTELVEKGITLDWHRYEIGQLLNGAVIITLYGESKE